MGAPNILMVNQYPGRGQEGLYKAWDRHLNNTVTR
jgi:hypothetical protein